MTRNKQVLEEAYISLEHASNNLGLPVNSQKTNNMLITKNDREEAILKIKINGSEFERLDSLDIFHFS